jgi:hypothetical protein
MNPEDSNLIISSRVSYLKFRSRSTGSVAELLSKLPMRFHSVFRNVRSGVRHDGLDNSSLCSLPHLAIVDLMILKID